MKKTRLKGGSLSSIYHMVDKESEFIRKECRVDVNREFGFQRWYSQLKRLQRYSNSFPNLYPKVLNFGQEGELAFFDLEFISGSLTALDYLLKESNDKNVDRIFETIVAGLDRMHEHDYKSSESSIKLYLHEKVQRKLELCKSETKFLKFYDYKEIVFNGISVPSLSARLESYCELMTKFYTYNKECYVHGNITLENILYIPTEHRVVFVDPYEENIIDSPLIEYSQLMQSSNGNYERYNASITKVEDNRINAELTNNFGLKSFDNKLNALLLERYGEKGYFCIKLFEISQFVRMLPFKVKLDVNKALFFYGLASKLFHDIEREIS